MTTLTYAKPERIWLKNHPEFKEAWLQERIAKDPSLLGLGDLILRDKERRQPGAGRLDILLQDVDATRRYEVEIQLGKTDEAHIVRTIEYWDIERKRYPQYDHTAVIVAEDITSRFLNVVGLFNGAIPLIAIQLSALRLGDSVSLVFTKVLDELQLGLVDEDEEVQQATNRAYWEERATKQTMGMVDELFKILSEFDAALELNYNKAYIGLVRNGQSKNFVSFSPKKSFVWFKARLERSDEIEAEMESSGVDDFDYKSWGAYQFRLYPGDIEKHRELLTSLMKQAYDAAF